MVFENIRYGADGRGSKRVYVIRRGVELEMIYGKEVEELLSKMTLEEKIAQTLSIATNDCCLLYTSDAADE